MAALDQWRSHGAPPRPPTTWNRNTWQRQFPAHRTLLDRLPSDLDRDAITVHARNIDDPPAAVRAFIAAMVWGYGTSGYGPFRTNRVLERNPDAARRLLEAAQAVRADGPLAGFDVIAAAPLKYLGVAFSTKYLYYCSRAVSHHHGGRTAPILDKVMSDWMLRYTGAAFALVHNRDSYRRYVALLEQWGARLDLPADEVEERIYVSALTMRSRAASAPSPAAAHTALEALTRLNTALDSLGLTDHARTELRNIERLLTTPTTT